MHQNEPFGVAGNHHLGGNCPVGSESFDWAVRALVKFGNSDMAWESSMIAAVAGFLVVLSIGILVAHALDAFGSG
jgi:hypothetical protein